MRSLLTFFMEKLNEVVENSSIVTKFYLSSLGKEPQPADYDHIKMSFEKRLREKGYTEEEIEQIFRELENEASRTSLAEKVALPRQEVRYIRQLQRASVDEVFHDRIFEYIEMLAGIKFPDRGKQIEAMIYLKSDKQKRLEIKEHPETEGWTQDIFKKIDEKRVCKALSEFYEVNLIEFDR